MAEKKRIEVEFRDSGLDSLDQGLDRVEQGLHDVDKAGDKAARSVDDVAGNGGAIAILDSLTGGLATRLRDAYEASRLFNVSLKGMRTALIATGIGAFVVAMGLVVAYWDEITDFIAGANKSLERQIELQNTLIEQHDRDLAILEAKKGLLEAEGKSTEGIITQMKEVIRLRISDGEQQITNLQAQLKKEKSVANEYSWYQKIGVWRFGQKTTEQEQADIDATNAAIDDLIISTTNAKKALAELNNPAAGTGDGEALDKEKKLDVKTLPIVQTQIEITAALMDEATKREAELTANAAAGARLREHLARQEAAVIVAQEEYKSEARMNALSSFANFARAMAGQSRELMIAGIIAEQIMSASNIIQHTGIANAKAIAMFPLTAGQPWVTINTVSAGLSIASGLAASLQAVSQLRSDSLSPTRFSPASPSGGGGGQAIQQPDFNIVGQSGLNQLAETISEREQKPLRAYVVSDDVESAKELDRRISDTASIG